MDKIKSVLEYGGTMFVGAVNFMFTNPGVTAVLAAVPAAVLTTHLMSRMTTKRGLNEDMKRRVKLEATYADRIHDFMFDLLCKGEITRHEYKRDLKRMGIGYQLFDLLRPMKARKGLAHRVKHNIAVNHSTMQHIQPGKIPGPKPGEDVPTSAPVKKRKVYLAVVGNRQRG